LGINIHLYKQFLCQPSPHNSRIEKNTVRKEHRSTKAAVGTLSASSSSNQLLETHIARRIPSGVSIDKASPNQRNMFYEQAA